MRPLLYPHQHCPALAMSSQARTLHHTSHPVPPQGSLQNVLPTGPLTHRAEPELESQGRTPPVPILRTTPPACPLLLRGPQPAEPSAQLLQFLSQTTHAGQVHHTADARTLRMTRSASEPAGAYRTLGLLVMRCTRRPRFRCSLLVKPRELMLPLRSASGSMVLGRVAGETSGGSGALAGRGEGQDFRAGPSVN